MQDQSLENLRNDSVNETNYTPAAEARARSIPIKMGIPMNTLPHTKIENMGVAMDPRAGGQYNPRRGDITVNPGFTKYPRKYNQEMIRHELIHSMDSNTATPDRMYSLTTPEGAESLKMLMGGDAITNSFGMVDQTFTPRMKSAWTKQLGENGDLYQANDPQTQDVEALANYGSRYTNFDNVSEAPFAAYLKSVLKEVLKGRR